MYKPHVYRIKDKAQIWEFIEKYPFAFLTTKDGSGKSIATQVPLIFDKNRKVLQGHVMKHTDHHSAFLQNPQVLAVFTGPNAYISGSWYSQPNVASTWNYMSVHINGTLNFMSEGELIHLMKEFTLKFEDGDNNSPTIYDNIPKDYLNQHMKAIAGFDISIKSIEATFKLSQDKDDDSFENIIQQLELKSLSERLLANEMKENKKMNIKPRDFKSL